MVSSSIALVLLMHCKGAYFRDPPSMHFHHLFMAE
jgi:hypothetical protein